MPFYDYYCIECHKVKELFMKIVELDINKINCPYCGAEMKRGVNKVNLHGVWTDPVLRDYDDYTKNELARELAENDKHRKAEEKGIKKAIKDGDLGSNAYEY